jgi:adenine-specific DNA-methyltransferase
MLYDSSPSPALDWDGQSHARELGEWLLAQIQEASRLDRPHRFPEPRSFGDVEIAGLHDAVEMLAADGRRHQRALRDASRQLNK